MRAEGIRRALSIAEAPLTWHGGAAGFPIEPKEFFFEARVARSGAAELEMMEEAAGLGLR